MNRSESRSKSILPTLFLMLTVLASGEILCRGLDAYDAWKKYDALLGEVVNYRGQPYSISKPRGVKRVLVLGGSAVHDTPSDYRESWPYFLEEKLNEKSDSKIEVINMGFYSESSIDELFKLNDFGIDLDPDLVIVFDGQNDVYNAFHHYDYYQRLYELKNKPILHEKKRNPVTRFFHSLRKQSALYRRLNQFKKNVTLTMSAAMEKTRSVNDTQSGVEKSSDEAAGAQENAFSGVSQGPAAAGQFFEDAVRWPEIRSGYLSIYSENLDKMARLIRKAGARGLLIFQPDLSYKFLMTGQVTENERKEYLKIVGNHEREWMEIQKMTYADAVEKMRETAGKYGIGFEDFNSRLLIKENDVSGYFDGNVHFSSAGRVWVAGEIAALIKEKKLL